MLFKGISYLSFASFLQEMKREREASPSQIAGQP
jgi:hypothetical protein